MPELPEEPFAPEVPLEPEEPLAPDVPLLPEEPLAPEVPELPEVPEEEALVLVFKVPSDSRTTTALLIPPVGIAVDSALKLLPDIISPLRTTNSFAISYPFFIVQKGNVIINMLFYIFLTKALNT